MTTKAIDNAILAYQAATTPAAIQKAVRSAKRRGHAIIDAASVRAGAADLLRESIERELAR